MALDPNIILSGKPATLPSYYENQLNQSKINSALQDGQMNDIKIKQYNQSLADKAHLDGIYSGYNGDNKSLTQKLIQSGNIKEGIDIGNFGTEQTTKDLANTTSKAKIVGQVAGSILNAPPEKIHDAASQGIDYLQQNNVYTPEFAAHAKEQIANMQPAELTQFLQQLQTQALSPEQQLPKVSVEDNGGYKQPIAQSPITGAVTQVGSPMMKTQTPEQANKPPETKTMRVGTDDTTQQWNPNTKTWEILASGNAFKPDATVNTMGANINTNLHGDDFLGTLDPKISTQVKALAEGRMAFPSGFALKTPYWQEMLQALGQYDPSFDAVNYNARSKTRNDFTSGKSSQNIKSLGTAIGHLGTLNDQIDGTVSTGGYPFATTVNSLGNEYNRRAGDAGVTNYEQTASALSTELTQVFRGSGGAEADVQRYLEQLNSNASKEQKKAAVKNIVDLLDSRLNSIGDQYNQGMGTSQEPIKLLNTKAQQVYNKLHGIDTPPSQTKQPSQNNTTPSNSKVINGVTYVHDGKGWKKK